MRAVCASPAGLRQRSCQNRLQLLRGVLFPLPLLASSRERGRGGFTRQADQERQECCEQASLRRLPLARPCSGFEKYFETSSNAISQETFAGKSAKADEWLTSRRNRTLLLSRLSL